MTTRSRLAALLLAGALTGALGVATAHAAVLASDNFDNYALGDLKGKAAGGNGWGSGYSTNDSTNDTTAQFKIVNTTPLSAGAGQYVTSTDSSYAYAVRELDHTAVVGTFAAYISGTNQYAQARIDQGVLWASMLVRYDTVSAQKPSSSSYVGFDDSRFPNQSGRTVGAYVGYFGNPGYWSVGGLNGAGVTTVVTTTTPIVAGQTELVVMKLDLDNDVVSYYFNPTSAASAHTDVSYTNLGLVSFRLRDLAPDVDNVQVGQSFADVTPIPEPASLALLGLGGLAMLMRRRKGVAAS